jgi:hypothetical protein
MPVWETLAHRPSKRPARGDWIDPYSCRLLELYKKVLHIDNNKSREYYRLSRRDWMQYVHGIRVKKINYWNIFWYIVWTIDILVITGVSFLLFELKALF